MPISRHGGACKSTAHQPEAVWLLDQIGVQPGWRAVDVGCGPLGILNLLSDRVGPTGAVIGLDNEPRMLEMGRGVVADLGLQNVQLIQGEAAASGLPEASFDFAHARLVLINVPNPEEVLREMTALVRIGGVVAVQDLDWISWTCEPSHPAWDRLISILTAVRRARGLDVSIGRRLPGMFRSLGLVDVQMKAFAGQAVHRRRTRRLDARLERSPEPSPCICCLQSFVPNLGDQTCTH